jgi:hypothetical protein
VVSKCFLYIFNIDCGLAEVKRRVKYYDKNNYFFESVERFWRGQLKCFENKLKSNKKEAGSLFPDSPPLKNKLKIIDFELFYSPSLGLSNILKVYNMKLKSFTAVIQ